MNKESLKRRAPKAARSEAGSLSRRKLKGITLAEIQDMLLDDGYSTDERKTWLKRVLTDLSHQDASDASPEKARLIEDVKRVIRKHQRAGTPIAEDVL